jgi:hypothetical protein
LRYLKAIANNPQKSDRLSLKDAIAQFLSIRNKPKPMLIPKSFDGYHAAIHPPYDCVAALNDTRYRLIQQRQTQPAWDISIPGQFLGRIEWFQRSNCFGIININRATVARPQMFERWEDAVVALDRLALAKAVAA